MLAELLHYNYFLFLYFISSQNFIINGHQYKFMNYFTRVFRVLTSYEWKYLDHAMTLRKYFLCDKWKRTQEQEYKRDFHLFSMFNYSPFTFSHTNKNHIKTHLLTYMQKHKLYLFACASFHQNKNFILAYHVKHIMGKCIPKVLLYRGAEKS